MSKTELQTLYHRALKTIADQAGSMTAYTIDLEAFKRAFYKAPTDTYKAEVCRRYIGQTASV